MKYLPVGGSESCILLLGALGGGMPIVICHRLTQEVGESHKSALKGSCIL